jgi:probable LLM family oxidoreductase
MQIGLTSFAEVDPRSGDAGQRLRDLVEEIALADEVGLDVFGVGEHHRADFAVSAPAVVLAAAAARTRRIRLASAVTVLSSDDPVRVFQAFATLDGISGGRAEVMAGRGSFVESFPLFGHDLGDYDALFAEKLELLLALRAGERVRWRGRFRPPIDDLGVYPRPVQRPLPVWVAVGGTPASAVRTGSLGLPMALAIIGGEPARFQPIVDLYREAGGRAGHAGRLELGVHAHTWIGDDSQAAADEYFSSYATVMSRIGRERGWPPMSRGQYEAMRTPRGALLVGSPQQVVDKILHQHELFGLDRFLAHVPVGPMPHAAVMRVIELLGTVVAPEVKKAVGAAAGATT